MTDNIGIAITTHNRPGMLAECLQNLVAHTPKNVPIVVVDDGSTPPAKVPAEYECTIVRHPVALGIPAAKNACIEALMDEDVEHLFLLDDDTYPLLDGWWKPYVDGPEPHYQYNWVRHKDGRGIQNMHPIYRDRNLVGYRHSMGCMLYVTRDVINRVGGIDLQFGMGVEEHIEWSQRIHNADLTTFAHQAVTNDEGLWRAADEWQRDISSVNRQARAQTIQKNTALRLSMMDSDRYVEYRTPQDRVIAFYSNTHPDPQRQQTCRPGSVNEVQKLVDSVGPWSGRMVVLTDCLPARTMDPVETHDVPTPLSPYFQRWLSEYQYLRANPGIRYAWVVDATDVTMLHDPFPAMKPDTLYCGWEGSVVGCDWVRWHSASVSHWVDSHADEMLLNCGVVGGDRATLMNLCRRMIDCWLAYHIEFPDPMQETVWFNTIAREHPRLVTGPQVTTPFKSYDTNDEHAWFCHK